MTTEQTALANSIDASESKANLDEAAKKLVRHKIILAEILKECVDEFREYDIPYIMDHCFASSVHTNEIAVDQDMLDADSSIVGANTEDGSNKEGVVRYDLIFDAVIPKTKDIIRVIISIEIQVEMNPGYPIITRAIDYLGRLISRQKGTVFTRSDYGKLHKVYSIWICPDPSRAKSNQLLRMASHRKR